MRIPKYADDAVTCCPEPFAWTARNNKGDSMKQLLDISEAVAEIGSRTTLYGLIGEGKIRALKIGARTKIDAASLREFIAGLPEARISPPRRRSAA